MLQENFVCPWDGWVFTRLLGNGAYGRVYLVSRQEYGSTYYSAIKHIPIPGDTGQIDDIFAEGMATNAATLQTYCMQILESFMTEININVELRGHTNFVSYDDHKIIPRADGPGYDIYIKMEYLQNLTGYMREFPIRLLDVVKLGEDLCNALAVLQKRSLVHRDVKPENIFISRGGDFKLGDFGISRMLDESVTRMSARGTTMFMAPELIRQEKGDYRVDIYSFGLVLYRLLNGGRAPFLPPPPALISHFEYHTAQELRVKGDPLPPPAFADAALSGIILRACAFEPDRRWRDAAEMLEHLYAYRASLTGRALQTVVMNRLPGHGESGQGQQIEHRTKLLFPVQAPSTPPAPPTFAPHPSAAPTYAPPTGMPSGEPPAPPYPPYASHPSGAPAYAPPAGMPSGAPPYVPHPSGAPAHAPPAGMPSGEPPAPPFAPRPAAARSRAPQKALVLTLTAAALLTGALLYYFRASWLPFLAPRSSSAPPTPPSSTQETPSSAVSPPSEPPSAPPTSSGVLFADAAIGAAVRAELQKPADAVVTPEDLMLITELQAEGDTVTSLADLPALPNLKVLRLRGQSLPDPSPLAFLPGLEVLNLAGCRLGDAAFLGSLTGLTRLDISANELSDIQFARSLTGLTYLNIGDNHIEDLSPLAALPALETLAAAGNPVADWSVVAHIPHVDGAPSTPTPTPPPTPATRPTPTPTPRPTPTRPTPTPTPPEQTPEQPPAPAPTPTPPPVVPVSGVTVSPGSALLDVGERIHLTAAVAPADATSKTVTWSSANTSVASVDRDGNVTALGAGTVYITASCGGRSGRCVITVG
ncbi:MAG: protein kinase [Oscillospiraceae bacterium]|nr:protein kinase [Oscillospiraceae bacterium]